MGSTTSSSMYEDAASLGKFRASFGLVIAGLISVGFLGYSIYLFMRKNPYTEKVNATVTKSTCIKQNGNYNCTLSLSYRANNTDTIGTLDNVMTETKYEVNDMITVYYNPSNPEDISLRSREVDKDLGYTFLFFSIFILISAVFVWWLVNRYKFFAAGEGVAMVSGLFR